MKKSLIFAVLLSLSFVSCDAVNELLGTGDDEGDTDNYARLEGDWLVDIGTRPEDWKDYKYSFNGSNVLEIYHRDDAGAEYLNYRGLITSVTDTYLDVDTQVSDGDSNPYVDDMRMAYAFVGESGLRIGWYSDPAKPGIPVWYLSLTRQN